MKDGLVRADTLPLVFRAVGAEPLPRGARVRVRIGATDLLTLDVHASVVERLGDDAPASRRRSPTTPTTTTAEQRRPADARDRRADDAQPAPARRTRRPEPRAGLSARRMLGTALDRCRSRWSSRSASTARC